MTEHSVGTIVAHCSEHEGPADVGVSLQLPEGRQLWCGEITRKRWEDCGEDVAHLGADDFGWWIILYSKDDTKVIGKCVDKYVAEDMVSVLAAAMRSERR